MAKHWKLAAAVAIVFMAGSALFYFRSLIFGSQFGSEYEEPAHDVVLEDGDIQVRRYEPYVVAEVTLSGSFDRATQDSFGPLFRYISGNNRSRQNLDMTAPVLVEPAGSPSSEKLAMTIPVLVEPRSADGAGAGRRLAGDGIDTWTMAFVLPAGYTAETAPLPASSNVVIRQVAAHEVASVRYSGRLSNESAERQRARLEAWLAVRGMDHQGDWRIATYDPPFTLPWFRRNEVLGTLR